MINVSDAFKVQVNRGANFLAYADITFADGAQLSLTPEDFKIGCSIDDCADSSSFPIGIAMSKTCILTLDNYEDKFTSYDFWGAKIVLYGAVLIPTGSDDPVYEQPDTYTVEKVKKGTFTVIDPTTPGEVIDITAIDDMYKTDKEYATNLIFPATAETVLRDACSRCDIDLGSLTFRNGSTIIPTMPTETTYREVIKGCALIAVGNARIDINNQLQILTWDFDGFLDTNIQDISNDDLIDIAEDPLKSITNLEIQSVTDFKTSPTIATQDVKITGVRYGGNDSALLSGEEGYVLSFENELVDGIQAQILDLMANELIGRSFRIFNGDVHGDITYEFGDPVYFNDYKGNTYQSFLTDVSFQFFGYTTLQCNAESPVRLESKPISGSDKTYKKAAALVEQERTDRELAIENLSKAIEDSSGLYPSSVIQPDGSTIYYLHDKPKLEESQTIMMLAAEVIAISTDGGKTYPYGFRVTGEMIVKTLEASGVNANWINTGRIEVRDEQGNVTFLADYETGQVVINATSFTLTGGKTIQDIAEEAVNEFVENTYTEDIEAIEETKIETWYQSADPSLQWGSVVESPLLDMSGEPVLDMSGDQLLTNWNKDKYLHNGDIWHNTINNSEWMYVNGTWQPMPISDEVTQTIEQIREDAQNPSIHLSQSQIFNLLTNNGEIEGVYMRDGRLYINGTYVRTGQLEAYTASGTLGFRFDFETGDVIIQSVSQQIIDIQNSIGEVSSSIYNEVSNNQNITNEKFQEISKYIRFVDGNIILGQTGNEVVLKISNTRVSFTSGSTEVAYFSNNRMYITDGEFTNSLRIGNIQFVPEANGSMSIRGV